MDNIDSKTITYEELVTYSARFQDKDELNAFFASRIFELCITTLARTTEKMDIDKRQEKVKQYEARINLNERQSVQMISYFTLFTYYRHTYKFDLLKDLVNRFSYLFESFAINKHINLLLHLALAETTDFTYLGESYENTKDSLLSKNSGVLNCHGELVATFFEKHIDLIDNDLSSENKYIENAYLLMKRAIDMTADYSKFYVTIGRLLALLGQYEAAENQIKKAIGMEDDYHKVANYQLQLSMVNTLSETISLIKRVESYDKKMDATMEEFDETIKNEKKDNLKLISIFASALTFLFGNISIFSAVNGLKEIVIACLCTNALFLFIVGAILVYFSVPEKKMHKSNVFKLIIGGLLIGAAIALLFFAILYLPKNMIIE